MFQQTIKLFKLNKVGSAMLETIIIAACSIAGASAVAAFLLGVVNGNLFVSEDLPGVQSKTEMVTDIKELDGLLDDFCLEDSANDWCQGNKTISLTGSYPTKPDYQAVVDYVENNLGYELKQDYEMEKVRIFDRQAVTKVKAKSTGGQYETRGWVDASAITEDDIIDNGPQTQ